ncbi:MAG: hypothetical protein IJU14_01250 [Clostridia bacterium]|nr:hypothetical protein [Clostridia bacterium]
MKAFTDYNQTQEYTYTEQQKLPAGAYRVKLIRAEETNNGNCLAILFDINGGEFDNYYHEKFKNDRNGNFSDTAKYKGVYRLFYPNGTQYDENNKRRIKTALENIKRSNPQLNVDFSKEWDGKIFKDCIVGMIFQDREWEYNGSRGMTAQPYSIISLEQLENGNFKIPEPKYLANKPSVSYSANNNDNFSSLDDDEDLPF